jgi:hypothetical protein
MYNTQAYWKVRELLRHCMQLGDFEGRGDELLHNPSAVITCALIGGA